ncbi:topoisomerase DNA-binding C4 zinc finger domain-containing protein [Nitrobacter sp. JJSN]|uniref:topoisomerase DNA-binding C4 zinc finger domain-containing protein n=1 Tax=Nitrobacter sp. JJSN TaxID=3453033 RepID=UPI003F75778C
MESEYGRPLFLDTDLSNVHVPNGRLDPAAGFILDIPALLSAINGVAIPPYISVPVPQVPGATTPSQAAIEALSKKRFAPLTKIAGIGIMLGAAYALASGVPGLVSLGIAGFGGWLVFRSPSLADGFHSEHREYASALSSHVEQLQRSSPIERVLRKKAEALDAIDEFKQLASAFGNIRNDYEKHRREKQLDDHLSQFTIRGARIPKVNSSDIAQLASYGFTTAFDAKRRDVQQVHGIGPVKAPTIAAWIRRVEAKFQFHSAHTPEDKRNIQKAQNEIITKQQGLEERLKKLVGEFRQEAQGFERWKTSNDPELARLTRQLAQAEADLSHVGCPVPSRPNVVPLTVPPVSTFQRGGRPSNFGTTFTSGTQAPPAPAQPHAVSCPRCGNPMVRRTARRGSNAGRPFWGCSRYPRCTGTRPI